MKTLTVKQLIDELQNYSDETKVCYYDGTDYLSIESAEIDIENDEVYIVIG